MKRNENLGGLAIEERSIERISENIIPFIKIRLRKLESGFFGKVDIENFATRMTNQWFSSLSDAQKEAWGIKKQEVGRRGVFTYFDAKKFSEGSEALRHLEDFLIEKIEKSKARSGELEPMPSGWKTVVSLVQDDIRTADPSFADSVNLRQVAKTWMNKWLESISDAEKEHWSIRRYLAKGLVVWCYSDVDWSHDSEQRSALKSFINKEIASSKKMRSEVEYIEEGWQTVNSLVERELFALKPEINTLISGVDTFVSRLRDGKKKELVQSLVENPVIVNALTAAENSGKAFLTHLPEDQRNFALSILDTAKTVSTLSNQAKTSQMVGAVQQKTKEKSKDVGILTGVLKEAGHATFYKYTDLGKSIRRGFKFTQAIIIIFDENNF